MEIEYLYHGSPINVREEPLVPNKARDLENRPGNTHHAVYATSNKLVAIVMSLLKSRGVGFSALNIESDEVKGIIYEGWPEQEHTYLYTLPTESFSRTSKKSAQFYSKKPVKPLRCDMIKVEDYFHYIRKATEQEKRELDNLKRIQAQKI